MREGDRRTRFPRIEPNGRISGIRLSAAALRFAPSLSVGSTVCHPMQAVSFSQLFTDVLGSAAASGFGVFLPQPSSDSRLLGPLQLGEHSRAVAVMKAPAPLSLLLLGGGEVAGAARELRSMTVAGSDGVRICATQRLKNSEKRTNPWPFVLNFVGLPALSTTQEVIFERIRPANCIYR